MYPICGLLVGGGNFVSKLLLSVGAGTGEFFSAFIAMIVGVVPTSVVDENTIPSNNGASENGIRNDWADEFLDENTMKIPHNEPVSQPQSSPSPQPRQGSGGVNTNDATRSVYNEARLSGKLPNGVRDKQDYRKYLAKKRARENEANGGR